MKYFKHYSNARASNKLTRLFAKTGFEGYGRYWALLEEMAFKFDGFDENFVFSAKDLKDILGFYHLSQMLMYLQCMSDVGLMSFKCEDDVVSISTPILLELQSRDFKKARTDRAETAPKNKIKNKINTNKETRAPIDVSSVYEAYPRKKGKLQGIKKLQSFIANEEDLQRVLLAVEKFRNQMRLEKRPADKIPHFSTFVNNQLSDYLDYEPDEDFSKKQPDFGIRNDL